MTFDDFALSNETMQAIHALGFETPTPIQELMIPRLLADHVDLVGLAHTGTGKTAAFGLPIIENIQPEIRAPQALVLCPTRELCIQICAELGLYARYMPKLSITSIYGGDSYERQIRAVIRGTHIITATPGRLLDLLEKGIVDLSTIRFLVLDEADIMLNLGFKDQIDAILHSAPGDRQTVLLSATMPKEVEQIARSYMNDPLELSAGRKNSSTKTVEHRYYIVRIQDKYQALKRIVDYHPDIYGIIFCRTRVGTREIAEKLVQDGYSAEALHGDLSQAQREQVMSKFRSRSLKLLVATDIAARGLDVDDLSHVVHYDLPTESDVYTHRSGRTGRAGKAGTSLALIGEQERSRLCWIERSVNRDFSEIKVPGKREICEKQLMQLIDRVTSVEVADDQISSYLPLIEEKLATLSREELIKRFVSLEFNTFLQYYRDLDDIRSIKHRERQDPKRRRAGSSRRQASNGFDWLSINIGKQNRVLPMNIIGMVNKRTRSTSVRLGRIDIGLSKSWVQVESNSVNLVERALQNATFQGQKLKVQRVEKSPGRARKRA